MEKEWHDMDDEDVDKPSERKTVCVEVLVSSKWHHSVVVLLCLSLGYAVPQKTHGHSNKPS